MAFGTGFCVVALAACGSSSTSPAASPGTGNGARSGQPLGLAMDLPRNDHSFGEATYTGAVSAAKQFGLKLSVIDTLAGKNAESRSALTNLGRAGGIVIVGTASISDQELVSIAKQFPKTTFGVYAIPRSGAPNIFSAVQDWYSLGYEAGVVAAHSSKTKVVGFVGGGLIPPTVRALAGYKAGVTSVDGSVKVVDAITGSFTDPTLGKSATSAQIAQHADVIYSFLDAAHAGAVQAALDANGVRVMGVITSKCEGSSGRDIGDTVNHQDGIVINMVKAWVAGTPRSETFELEHPDAASFDFCPSEGTASLTSALQNVTADFNSGRIKVPAMGS